MNRIAVSNTLDAPARKWGFSIRPKVFGLGVWAAVVIVQALLWFDTRDIIAILLTIIGGLLGTLIFLRRNLLAAYPISVTMLLGFTSYYFLLPPIATLIEGKPLTYNLEHPTLVLLHAFICLLSLTAAHVVYRVFKPLQQLRWTVVKKIYRPFGFFRTPNNVHLLVMGCFGLAAVAFLVFTQGFTQMGGMSGTVNKFIQAFYPLSFLPFVMLIKETVAGNERTPTRQGGVLRGVLIGYTVLLVLVSLGRNSRAAFLEGIASVGLVYAYGITAGLIRIPVVNPRRIVLAAVVAGLLLGPVADLATSMTIVRGERRDLPPMELVARTIDTFWDKEAIAARRQASQEGSAHWDEHYVSNVFLARLSNLKYADNSIELAMRMDKAGKSYMRDVEVQRALSVFPGPLIGLLGLPVDKGRVIGASGGDFMLYVVSGNSSVLGGFRTGSIFGSGYVLFGWWYPWILAGACLAVFPLADALTSRTKHTTRSGNEKTWRPILSPMAIIAFFSWFVYFTSAARGTESMSNLVSYPVRGWIQVLLIYTIAYWVTHPFARHREL